LIFYIWNQTQVGLDPPDGTTPDDNIMLVDYVQVWQKSAAGGSVPGS
jgi:hypothetical protein